MEVSHFWRCQNLKKAVQAVRGPEDCVQAVSSLGCVSLVVLSMLLRSLPLAVAAGVDGRVDWHEECGSST